MKFDIYGCFFVEVIRESGRWTVYRIDQGRRQRMEDLVLADDVHAEDIPHSLEDLLHEYASPDRTITMVE